VKMNAQSGCGYMQGRPTRNMGNLQATAELTGSYRLNYSMKGGEICIIQKSRQTLG